MDEWPGLFFGRTHTASTGTCAMTYFPVLVFHIQHQFYPWSVILFHHTIFIQLYHHILHNIILMRAVSGWFAENGWMVTCVNLEWNPRIGRINPSSQNASQKSVNTSLTFSCRSLVHPCSCRFFSYYFSLVCTSNSTTSSLGSRGYFAWFKGVP